MVASEVKNPQRNLPLALIGGTLGVIAIYMLANWAYFRVLTPAEVGAHKLVAAEMMQRIGRGPRGRERRFDRRHDFDFRRIERLDTDRRPGSLCGRAGRPVFPFGGAGSPGISYARGVDPDAERVVLGAGAVGKIRGIVRFRDFRKLDTLCDGHGLGFRAETKASGSSPALQDVRLPGGALLFLAGATVLEISTLWTKPRESIAGIILILLGLPFYFYWRSRMRRIAEPTAGFRLTSVPVRNNSSFVPKSEQSSCIYGCN